MTNFNGDTFTHQDKTEYGEGRKVTTKILTQDAQNTEYLLRKHKENKKNTKTPHKITQTPVSTQTTTNTTTTIIETTTDINTETGTITLHPQTIHILEDEKTSGEIISNSLILPNNTHWQQIRTQTITPPGTNIECHIIATTTTSETHELQDNKVTLNKQPYTITSISVNGSNITENDYTITDDTITIPEADDEDVIIVHYIPILIENFTEIDYKREIIDYTISNDTTYTLPSTPVLDTLIVKQNLTDLVRGIDYTINNDNLITLTIASKGDFVEIEYEPVRITDFRIAYKLSREDTETDSPIVGYMVADYI